jgi:LPXTG-motif cell wall-anchored protein
MSRTTLRRIVSGALLGLVLTAGGVVSAPAAVAADLPMPTFTPATGGPTAYFTVAGTGCTDTRPGKPVPGIILDSTTTTEFGDGTTAAPDGSWSIRTNFSGATLGAHTIVASCDRYDLGEEAYPTLNVIVSATGVTLAPAAATAAAPTQATCTSCTTVKAGDTIAVGKVVVMELRGYKPHEWVTVVMRSTPRELGRFQANAAGVVSLRFTVPQNGTTGSSHTLTFSGSLGTPDLVLPFKLGAPVKTLASTGADVTAPLVLGSTFLLAGGAALVASRRRKTETAQV